MISVIKYLLEGIAVGFALYLIPKNKITNIEIILISVTAFMSFFVLDFYISGGRNEGFQTKTQTNAQTNTDIDTDTETESNKETNFKLGLYGIESFDNLEISENENNEIEGFEAI